jgi:hypothetical protein
VAIYETTAQAEHVFGGLFKILIEDETFRARLAETGLTA